jgi:hypothetical protein
LRDVIGGVLVGDQTPRERVDEAPVLEQLLGMDARLTHRLSGRHQLGIRCTVF